jgi:hypothetical protein
MGYGWYPYKCIIKGANAQLIVQDIFAIKFNSALRMRRPMIVPNFSPVEMADTSQVRISFSRRLSLLTKEKEDEKAA